MQRRGNEGAEDEMTTKTLYRAEVVGCMLRPAELVDARRASRAGSLEADAHRAVEVRAVDDGLRIREEAGVDVAIDGETRRDIFLDFFVSGAEGLTPREGRTMRFRGATGDDTCR